MGHLACDAQRRILSKTTIAMAAEIKKQQSIALPSTMNSICSSFVHRVRVKSPFEMIAKSAMKSILNDTPTPTRIGPANSNPNWSFEHPMDFASMTNAPWTHINAHRHRNHTVFIRSITLNSFIPGQVKAFTPVGSVGSCAPSLVAARTAI